MSAQGEALAAELGLEAGDPELAMVIVDQTPEKYLASIAKAAYAKAQRLAAGGPNPPAGKVPPSELGGKKPVGRSPAVGGGSRPAENNPVKDIESTDALYKLAWEQDTGRRSR